MATRTFRITRVYIVPAESKAEARYQLDRRLLNSLLEADELLDFESIREIAPDKAKSWREILRDQLFGTNSAAKQPAANGSRS